MKHSEVITAWTKGQEAQGSRMRTDGISLYSYNLVIGHQFDDGRLVIFNYTNSGYAFKSVTTSRHVNLAIRCAPLARVCDPSPHPICVCSEAMLQIIDKAAFLQLGGETVKKLKAGESELNVLHWLDNMYLEFEEACYQERAEQELHAHLNGMPF
mgnify:FL=1